MNSDNHQRYLDGQQENCDICLDEIKAGVSAQLQQGSSN